MVHTGHRQRMRERFVKQGLEGFAPHEVLELILFYAIPQKNVNPLAHKLLNAFGSLHGVMEATPEQLRHVEGIGEYAATLLSLFLPLDRYYHQDAAEDKLCLGNRIQAENYCRNLLYGLRDEHFYCICLDAKTEVLGHSLIAKGSVSQVPAYPRRVVEAVLRYNAHSVILCHNHPGGTLTPSADDIEATERIRGVLQGIDVWLLDHLIVGTQGVCSMTRDGHLNREFLKALPSAAEGAGKMPVKNKKP